MSVPFKRRNSKIHANLLFIHFTTAFITKGAKIQVDESEWRSAVSIKTMIEKSFWVSVVFPSTQSFQQKLIIFSLLFLEKSQIRGLFFIFNNIGDQGLHNTTCWVYWKEHWMTMGVSSKDLLGISEFFCHFNPNCWAQQATTHTFLEKQNYFSHCLLPAN